MEIHNTNQDRYSYNFFNRETKPDIHTNYTSEDPLTSERKRDRDENKIDMDKGKGRDNEKYNNNNNNKQENGRGYMQTQTTGHDRNHLYSKQDPLTRNQGEINHSNHDLNNTRNGRAIKDRSTPAENISNGDYQGRDHHHRFGSAFSTRWSGMDGGDATGRDTATTTESRQGRSDLSSVDGRRTGEFLTIRDILDSKEIRDHISELRRSQNSNTSMQQTPKQEERDLIGSQDRRSKRDSLKSNPGAEFSMDQSLLERKFRQKLDAAIPASDFSARQSPTSGHNMHANGMTTSTTASRNYYGSPVPEKKRKERINSSYSPSESSQDEAEEEEEEEQEEEDTNDTVEWTKNDGSRNVTPRPQQTPTPLSARPPSQLFPVGGIKDTQIEQSPPHHQQQQPQPVISKRDTGDNGYGSDEISFEREVAIARAKRKFGASADKFDTRPSMSSGTQLAGGSNSRMKTASRLDHGRDLALEDLASPTKYGFGTRQQQQAQHKESLQEQHQQQNQRQASIPVKDKTDWRSNPKAPLPSTAAELSHIDDFTRHEDRFIKLAGSLGEGQAVASVIGTLKAMIRQHKREKREVMKSNKALQKNLQKTQKEVERMRKANEKLSRNKDKLLSHNAELRHGKGRASDSPNPEIREKENMRAGIQREMDKGEKSIEALQRRIDALESQRAEAERAQALEETELHYLLDSEDEDEDEDEDEEEDDESDIESESITEESDRDAQGDERENFQRRGSDTRNYNKTLHMPRPQLSASRKNSRIKGSLNSSSKAKYERRNHRMSGYEPSRSERKSTRSKSANPVSRRSAGGGVEKVEEVHIHHHVHYGEGSESPSRSRTGNDDPRTPPQDDEFGVTDEMHRLRIGSGFRPRVSTRGDHLDIPPAFSRSALSKSLPGQKSYLERYPEAFNVVHRPPSVPQPRRHHTEPRIVNGFEIVQPNEAFRDKEEEAFQPFRVRSSGALNVHKTSSKPKTRNSGTSGSRIQQLTAALSHPALRQKKVSIDLQRILSLLKTHDPNRCTVCCNGGDGLDHDQHHQHHQNHGENHQAPRHQNRQKSLRVSTNPTRQGPLVTTKSSTKGIRYAISDESDSEPSLSSIPSDNDNDKDNDNNNNNNDEDNDIGTYEYKRGRSSMHNREEPWKDDLPPLNQKEQPTLHSSNDKAPTPEQKLHVILGQLEGEVQQLRRSYFELSKDLEAIERSTDVDQVNGESSLSAHETSASKLEKRSEAFREQQVRQKKLIKEQLQEVADSLAEKADVVLRLQEQYVLQRRQQQQSREHQRKFELDRGLGRSREEEQQKQDKGKSKKVSDSRHDELYSKRKGGNGASHGDSNIGSSSQRKSRRGSFAEPNEHGEEHDQGKKEIVKDDVLEDEDQNSELDEKNDTQDTARPVRRQNSQRSSPSKHDNDINNSNKEETSDKKSLKQSDRPSLKEPEGYRHRLSGFRVPQLH
ncbi:hypothetical protein BGZ49_004696 [Haplosporangium sp. Z 27]|nr:hypothetical protein BGZ49_004696 [Haplosporangium sp. Z 27]